MFMWSLGPLCFGLSFALVAFTLPRVSRYLIVKELGLEDHFNSGFWDLIRYCKKIGYSPHWPTPDQLYI